jgi:FkbM family methyltransferase
MDLAFLKEQAPFEFHEIFELNVYLMSKENIEGYSVLDLGGHFGLFASYCSTFNPKRIVSVEANINNFIKYLNNTKDIPNIKCINAAVSTKQNTVLTISDEQGSSTVGKGDQLIASITIESLMSIFDPNDKLVLKIDIEGSEYDILYHTPPDVFKRFHIIMMEAHNFYPETRGDEADRLKQYITSMGFTPSTNFHVWSPEYDKKYNGMKVAMMYNFVRN